MLSGESKVRCGVSLLTPLLLFLSALSPPLTLPHTGTIGSAKAHAHVISSFVHSEPVADSERKPKYIAAVLEVKCME